MVPDRSQNRGRDLEQIAPSPAAHARILCEEIADVVERKWRPKFSKSFNAFGPQLNAFMSAGIFRKYFRRKFLQFEWSKTVSNLGMSRFISLTKFGPAASFRRNSHNCTLIISHM